jgi:hypothetical protein
MKISQAISQLIILTYALATTMTTLAKPAYLPPVFDGYVDPKSIKMLGPNVNFLQVNGTNFALEERGVDSENIASRQAGTIMLTSAAILLVTGFALLITGYIGEDNPVSRNSMLIVLLALILIRHSVVRHTPRGWLPPCTIMTLHSTMLHATLHIPSHSTGHRAQIGIICTMSWVYHLEGQ